MEVGWVDERKPNSDYFIVGFPYRSTQPTFLQLLVFLGKLGKNQDFLARNPILMIRGLLWLPLLAIFIWLAWAGWNEYQKLEAYRTWASQFDRAKYDIYAVLGQKADNLTWGKPTRSGPVNLETFSLKNVQSIRLLVDDLLVELDTPPSSGRGVALEFILPNSANSVRIPFTEIALAVKWGKYLQQQLPLFQNS